MDLQEQMFAKVENRKYSGLTKMDFVKKIRIFELTLK